MVTPVATRSGQDSACTTYWCIKRLNHFCQHHSSKYHGLSWRTSCIHSVGFKCKRRRGPVLAVYYRNKPVSSVNKYKISRFSYESSGRIRLSVKETLCIYQLNFYPKVIYKNPTKSIPYKSVIQWHIGNNLYKLFMDIAFNTTMDLLDSQP